MPEEFDTKSTGQLNPRCSVCDARETAYTEKHEDKMQKYGQAYKEQNKERIAAHKATKITCQCGITHSIGDKARHAKSEEHIDRLKYPNGFKVETADGLTLVVSYSSPSPDSKDDLL